MKKTYLLLASVAAIGFSSLAVAAEQKTEGSAKIESGASVETKAPLKAEVKSEGSAKEAAATEEKAESKDEAKSADAVEPKKEEGKKHHKKLARKHKSEDAETASPAR